MHFMTIISTHSGAFTWKKSTRTAKALLAVVLLLQVGTLELSGFPSLDEIPPYRLSLEEALHLFLQNNSEMLVARASALRLEEETKIGTLWPNPSFEWEQERFDTSSQQFFILNQSILNPLEYSYRRKSSDARSKAVWSTFLEEASALILEMKRRYVEASAAKNRSELLTRVTQTVRRIFEVAKVRTEEGNLGAFELNRLSAEVAAYEEELAQSRLESRIALRELMSFISRSPEDSGKFDTEQQTIILDRLVYKPLDYDTENLISKAIESRGLLASLHATSLAEELRFKAEKASRFPELSLRGGLTGEPTLTSNLSPYLGLSIGIPIWDQKAPQIQAASRALQESEAGLVAANRRVNLDVLAAYDEVESYRSRIEKISSLFLINSDSLLPDAAILYGEGKITLLEFLDAAAAAKEAKLLELRLLHGHTLSHFKLDRAVGVLPSELKSDGE